MKRLLPFFSLLFLCQFSHSQTCTPAGDQTSYGSNDVWLGYVYDNANLTGYAGYVQQGSAGNPQFDQNFGGDDVLYNTNGCSVQTQTFSVRYKLQKTFTAGGYQFTVGGDDGYRLSIDGGASWLINRWQDQGYVETTATVYLDGSYDLVLEYYENGGSNRIRFALATACVGSEDPAEYGSSDVWRGYVYDGTAFNTYTGMVQEGSSGNISFDQNFGGSNVFYNTSSCPVQTETFSVRYRLRKNFPEGYYVFVVGGDDGFRLSLDGGNTWVINRWGDQSYTTSTYALNMSGWRDLVLEYYENGGDNRISLTVQSNIILKVDLLSLHAQSTGQGNKVNWDLSAESDPLDQTLERSVDGRVFTDLQTIPLSSGLRTAQQQHFSWTDATAPIGPVFYRIRFTDRDQRTVYSPTVRVSGSGAGTESATAFPSHLTNNQLYIRGGSTAGAIQWSLHDIQGRVMGRGKTGVLAAGQIQQIAPPLAGQPAGWYLLLLMTDSGEQTRSRHWWPGGR